ncbi:Arm DNA-binding domain-containing protein [Bacteroides cutis]|uniref:Arm DNA-binding domain-containing protein n=1 Tax=Bacteroides cutis TaxID=2024197 RepID=UPI0023A7D56B|nr:Arm DNA-binding domain-containing protein [Bacteroides cutis]
MGSSPKRITKGSESYTYSNSLFLCLNYNSSHGSVKPIVKQRIKTTVNVTCYKSKVLKNEKLPLMVRSCKNGKKKYISLEISVNPAHWDFKKNLPKSKCPLKPRTIDNFKSCMEMYLVTQITYRKIRTVHTSILFFFLNRLYA